MMLPEDLGRFARFSLICAGVSLAACIGMVALVMPVWFHGHIQLTSQLRITGVTAFGLVSGLFGVAGMMMGYWATDSNRSARTRPAWIGFALAATSLTALLIFAWLINDLRLPGVSGQAGG